MNGHSCNEGNHSGPIKLAMDVLDFLGDSWVSANDDHGGVQDIQLGQPDCQGHRAVLIVKEVASCESDQGSVGAVAGVWWLSQGSL